MVFVQYTPNVYSKDSKDSFDINCLQAVIRDFIYSPFPIILARLFEYSVSLKSMGVG